MTETADFGTKGYWRNKNGLAEIKPDGIDRVNGLLPYSSASSYFEAGDEPFNGLWDANGDGVIDSDEFVASSFNNEDLLGEIVAGEGTALAEISHFLTDADAGGDPRGQVLLRY